MKNSVNGTLLTIILLLTGLGFVIFLSASVGLVARESGANFRSIVFNQTLFGLLPGLVALFVLTRLPYKKLRGWSFYLLLCSIAISALVFVPGIGFEHGGAVRWISIGSNTFQPAELLKITVLIYFAAWLSMVKERVKTFQWGTVPFLILMGVVGTILVLQPDIDTFLVIFLSGLAMYIVAGAKIRHVSLLILLCLVFLTTLAFSKPYLLSRIQTFIDPSRDTLGSSYQIQQSLIAVGSGGFWGKGFGKSVQKFNYLPEPIGDSVYAVASEEFGFVGSVGLLVLFFLLASQGLRIANNTQDFFGRFLCIGIVVMFSSQAFINIGAMLGILPLSGITLPFVSHGGSALLFTLAEAGILLSISRGKRYTA